MTDLLKDLPPKPGVYIFRDSGGSALYIGKALNLKNRVRSYFQKGLELGPKTALMVSKIAKVEHIVVESEIEALLLEIDLIKRVKPRYNQQWKDDKNYRYIKISNSKFLISKVATSGTADDKSARYFGPFPEGNTVKQVLRTLRRVFPFHDCSKVKFKRYQKLGRACLFGDLKLCPAPCVGLITPKDYQKNVKHLIQFLSGRWKSLVSQLEREMNKASAEKKFEEAARLRDRMRSLEYVTQEFRSAKDYLEHPNLLEDQRRRELLELSRIVNREPLIGRVEAYDISNIAGQYAVGSLVVFVNGEPSKKDYRRFKIRTVEGIDDVGMIREVLRRRFTKVQKSKSKDQKQVQSSKTKKDRDSSFEKLPGLILIDGGKPQVGATNEVLKELELKIPVLGLAKRFEEIIKSDLSLVKLPKDSPALHLLQRVRDEAHRFAIVYHRRLRSKDLRSRG